MMIRQTFLLVVLTIFALFATSASATALDDYVNKPDPNYTYNDTGLTIEGENGLWTGYVVNMTSQQWLTTDDVDLSIWWHIMIIIVPKKLTNTESSFVWITGGSNQITDPIPDKYNEDIIVAATGAVYLECVSVALMQIPNEHLTFKADPKQQSRSEDAIIAYTWNHFVTDPSQPEWLLRLPMTKAVVRCMDTMETYLKKKFDQNIVDFYVAGASKRGWTTWTTAAVDKRVKAMAPIVMDELNMVHNLHHHFKAYGGWSFALSDYWKMNFTQELDNPNTQLMADIIDPISYVDRYVGMPKLIINAGGDEFFLPDDQTFWWNQMPEPKAMVMVPNAEHSLATGLLEVLPAVTAFFGGVMNKQVVPTYTWSIDNTTGDITVVASQVPKKVHVWHAYTCNGDRRDWRLLNADSPCTCGVAADGMCANLKVLWEAVDLAPATADGLTFIAHMDAPSDDRWLAFFIDLEFHATNKGENTAFAELKRLGWPIDVPGTYEFTSGVSVLPQTFPFADCHGQECLGTLV